MKVTEMAERTVVILDQPLAIAVAQKLGGDSGYGLLLLPEFLVADAQVHIVPDALTLTTDEVSRIRGVEPSLRGKIVVVSDDPESSTSKLWSGLGFDVVASDDLRAVVQQRLELDEDLGDLFDGGSWNTP